MGGSRRNQVRPSEATAWLSCTAEALRDACGERPGFDTPVLTVLSANEGGTRLEVELRFREGERYCCAEAICHLGAGSQRWWQNVREYLRTVSDREPPPLSLAVSGVVEYGALLDSQHAPGFCEVCEAYTYTAHVLERDAR
jgi:hypothetical protein